MPRGTLLLVVGPSGSGKDTLINGARVALAPHGRFAFPRREITRPADLGNEAHIAISEADFAARCEAGLYALHWRAHGLCYGIPRGMETALDEGRHVVVNVSRTIIDEARARYYGLRVIQVGVPEAVLRLRLSQRARDDEAEVARRLARADAYAPSGPDVVRFENDAPVETAVSRFVALLDSLAPVSA
ncbi:MAG: phosphonate metabolism protein/1,5-bisphosphokinase (PRPP-forming) PhnN [Alphaproteobacteria bacterium]